MVSRSVRSALLIVLVTAIPLACGGENPDRLRVVSPAMEPTLRCAIPNPGCTAQREDVLVVEGLDGDPERGDIVVFEAPPALLRVCGIYADVVVKRLIALPGDVVEIDNGDVSVNGETLDESYVADENRDAGSGRWQVPAQKYFVMGDNRDSSCDSRAWGAVDESIITGRVVTIERPSGNVDLEATGR